MMKENSQLATSRMIVGDRQDKGEREGRLRHCRERIGNCVIQCGSTPAFLFPRVFFRDPTGSGKKRLKLSLAPPEARSRDNEFHVTKSQGTAGPVERRAEVLQGLRDVGKLRQGLLVLLGGQEALHHVGQ